MFFHQGAKQNKGLKALVTSENVQKLMLNVNVVIFSNIFHSISWGGGLFDCVDYFL